MRWVSLTFTLLLLAVNANAEATQVQARLIRASNDEKLADERLKSLHRQLKKQFGYPYYQQMGEKQEALKADTVSRLDLGEGFVVFVTPKTTVKKVRELDIEWTSGKASLVKSTVKISEGGYLFIKGPAVANDWIVLALTVHE
jgi:3-oxoacyl-ACP reductase-like protein